MEWQEKTQKPRSSFKISLVLPLDKHTLAFYSVHMTLKEELKLRILSRNLYLDMFASRVADRNIFNPNQPESLRVARIDNNETDNALLEILYK